MQLLRKAAVGLLASLLVGTLFGLGLSWGIRQVIGADPIKGALRESGIYQTGVGDALDQAQKKEAPTQDTDVPVDNPDIRAIIKQAFPPEFLQSQSEHVLDSTFAWLQGDMPQLAFSVDLTEAKQRLADGIGQYAEQRLKTLPTCTATDLQQMGTAAAAHIDPLNAACVPPNFDTASAAAEAKNEILQGEFLKDTRIEPSTIKTEDGKPLDEQIRNVPDLYDGIRGTPVIMTLVAAGLIAGVIFLSSNRRAGIRRAAVITLTIGVTSMLLAWLLDIAIHRAIQEGIRTAAIDGLLQQKLLGVLEILVGDFRNWWIAYGAILTVLGIGTLLALHFTKDQKDLADITSSPEKQPELKAKTEGVPANEPHRPTKSTHPKP
jgi:hypothetical protein